MYRVIKTFTIILLLLAPIKAYGAYQYTVTYTADGNVVSTQRVIEGDDAKEPNAPEVDGKEFQSWSNDGKNIKRNMTIKAIYKSNSDNDNKTSSSSSSPYGANKEEIVTRSLNPAAALVEANKSGGSYTTATDSNDSTENDDDGLPPPSASTDVTERSIDEVESGAVTESDSKRDSRVDKNTVKIEHKNDPKVMTVTPIEHKESNGIGYKDMLTFIMVGMVTLIVSTVIIVYYTTRN